MVLGRRVVPLLPGVCLGLTALLAAVVALAVGEAPRAAGARMSGGLPPPPPPRADFFADDTDPKPSAEPEKTDSEKEFEELYTRYLAEMPRPLPGKKYRVRLKDQGVVEGKLVSVSPGRINLKVPYGVMTYMIQQVHHDSVAQLFPERVAKWKALKALHDKHPATASTEAAAEQAPAGTEPAPAEATRMPTAKGGGTPGGVPRYDPTPAETPEHLKSTIRAFGEWLTYQHRRVGGKIADRIFAKQQDRFAVLYVVADPLFLEQDYDTRFQLAEGLQKFWAFRCEATRVIHGLDEAHVVLVDARDRIVGGSSPDDSADVWVEKGKGGGR